MFYYVFVMFHREEMAMTLAASDNLLWMPNK